MYLRLTEADLKEVVYERNLPQDFYTSKGIEESTFQLQHRLGSASFREVWFEGVHVSHGNIQLYQDVRVNIEADLPVVEMHFNLSGASRAKFANADFSVNFDSQQHNVHYYPNLSGLMDADVDKVNNEMLEIHLTEAYFKRLACSGNPIFARMVENIDRGKAVIMNKHNGQITPAMQQLLQAIRYNNRQGALKRLSIESIVLELLMLQVEQFEGDPRLFHTPVSRQDADKLHQVKHLLEQNLQETPSLDSLARQTGLNDFKLKKGFKSLFGTTVFGYLHDLRMQQALRQLQDEHKTIAEVAEGCGYEYVQHFSTAFKKKFGVTPGAVRRA
ncbi:MAG: AraC family transcriptional regulator [Chitinophagaceae bacterium]